MTRLRVWNPFFKEQIILKTSKSPRECRDILETARSGTAMQLNRDGKVVNIELHGSVDTDHFKLTQNVRGIGDLNTVGIGSLAHCHDGSCVTIQLRYSYVDLSWFIAIVVSGISSGFLLMLASPILSIILVVGFTAISIIRLHSSSHNFTTMRLLLGELLSGERTAQRATVAENRTAVR